MGSGPGREGQTAEPLSTPESDGAATAKTLDFIRQALPITHRKNNSSTGMIADGHDAQISLHSEIWPGEKVREGSFSQQVGLCLGCKTGMIALASVVDRGVVRVDLGNGTKIGRHVDRMARRHVGLPTCGQFDEIPA